MELDSLGRERIKFEPEGWNFGVWEGQKGERWKVHYISAGPTEGEEDGPPIVLIHGFGAHAYHWRFNIPELAKKHRVYAPCLLGYGWSEKAETDFSTALWGKQVGDFLRNHVGEKAVLVGNSIGGVCALYAAAEDAPEYVAGVALLNAAGRFEDEVPSGGSYSSPAADAEKRAALAAEAADSDDNADFSQALTRSLEETKGKVQDLIGKAIVQFIFLSTKYRIGPILKQVYVDETRVDDELVQSIFRPAEDPAAPAAFYKISGSGARSPETLDSMLANLYDRVGCEVALLWGEKDPWIGPDKAYKIEALYPKTRLVMLDAGHCPHDDAAEELNRHLLEYINESCRTPTVATS